MPTAKVNGANLWYAMSGSGEVMVQIHGAGFGHQNFDPITPLMAERYRVLNLDLRGYGQSDRPEQAYSMKVWADDVAGLMDELGIEKAHIHGTSMGSMVAQQFAIDHPDRMLTLILTCGACKLDHAGWLTFEVWAHILERIGTDEPTLAMLLATQGFSREFLDGPGGKEIVETIRTTVATACTPRMFAAACRAMQAIDFIADLPSITVPTLVMTGVLDQMTPVDYGPTGGGSRMIAELIPNAQLVLLPEAGHTHLFSKPHETVDGILRFLDGVRRGEGAADLGEPSRAR